MKSDSWDRNVEFRINELEPRSDKTYWDLLVPLFKNYIKKIPQNKKIIDVGCGLGYLTNDVASFVQETIGIDTSFKSIEYAKTKFSSENLKFLNISIVDYQKMYPDVCYDICIANMVFHNIRDLDENIDAISKLLNKNGYLLFSIPHPTQWYNTRKFEKSPSFKYEIDEQDYQVPFKIKNHEKHPYDITYYHRSLERYAELLEKYHFTIESQKEPYLGEDPRNIEKDILFYSCILNGKKNEEENNS
jgi:SAM-dependent methyltransferase